MTEIVKLENVADGFSSPPQDAQVAYRALLQAMSRPGLRVGVDGHSGLENVAPSAAATLLTLLDFDTVLYLDAGLSTGPLEGWIRFHTGCRITDQLGEADFALFKGVPTADQFREARQGDPKYPDQSATFIVQVPSLSGGQSVTLRGPGIDKEVQVAAEGLDDKFWEAWRNNAAQFPLGIDVMVCSGADMIGLPRSSRPESDA